MRVAVSARGSFWLIFGIDCWRLRQAPALAQHRAILACPRMTSVGACDQRMGQAAMLPVGQPIEYRSGTRGMCAGLGGGNGVDGERFDNAVRVLATARSRRQALKSPRGGLAGALAAVAGIRGSEAAHQCGLQSGTLSVWDVLRHRAARPCCLAPQWNACGAGQGTCRCTRYYGQLRDLRNLQRRQLRAPRDSCNDCALRSNSPVVNGTPVRQCNGTCRLRQLLAPTADVCGSILLHRRHNLCRRYQLLPQQ